MRIPVWSACESRLPKVLARGERGRMWLLHGCTADSRDTGGCSPASLSPLPCRPKTALLRPACMAARGARARPLNPRAAVRRRQLIPSKVAWLQNTIGLTPWYKS